MLKKWLLRLLSRLNKESKFNRLQDFSHQQNKFRKRYPRYKIGNATYGIPIVHNYHESSTLVIGSYCSIASNVQIFLGGQHRVDWVSSYPFPMFFYMDSNYKEQCLAADSRGDVVIGSDVWLCANCTILSGVTIGHGAVIANGALISRDVEPYAVMVGNPAQRIKWRFGESTRNTLLESEWWNWSEEEITKVLNKICNNDFSDFMDYIKSREVKN